MQIIPLVLSLVFAFAYEATCVQLPMSHPAQGFEIGHALPLLYDLLIIQTKSTIFRDYLLSVHSIDALLRDKSESLTVLVPSNKAVQSMKRKPHESPPGDETEEGNIDITDEELESGRARNVRRWISAHVIPEHPIKFDESKSYPTMLHGFSVGFSRTNDTLNTNNWKDWTVNPGIRIIDEVKGLNGALYLIEGVVQS